MKDGKVRKVRKHPRNVLILKEPVCAPKCKQTPSTSHNGIPRDRGYANRTSTYQHISRNVVTLTTRNIYIQLIIYLYNRTWVYSSYLPQRKVNITMQGSCSVCSGLHQSAKKGEEKLLQEGPTGQSRRNPLQTAHDASPTIIAR